MSTPKYALRQLCNLFIVAGYMLGATVVGAVLGAVFGSVMPSPAEAVETASHTMWFCTLVGAAFGIRRCWG